MSSKKRNPKWWQLYVMLPLLAGLFWPEIQAPLTETGHIIAQLGILCLIFGFVQLWMRANRSALMHMDEEQGHWRINAYEILLEQPRAAEDTENRTGTRPLLEIPASGVSGVLSDTFELGAPEEQSSVFRDQGIEARKEQE